MAGHDHQANHDKNDILQILASHGVEFLLFGEEEVSLLSCVGKKICLLFSANWCKPCKTFTPQLTQVYKSVQKRGEKLEIIFISLDRNEKEFEGYLSTMPWLAAPFDTELQKQLCSKYGVDRIPWFVPVYADGIISKEDDQDFIGFIEDYGAEAFPFTTKRRQDLKALDCAKRQNIGTPQLLFGTNGPFFISTHPQKTQVSQLVGKTIGLYFAAYWSPPSRAFTTKLTKVYNELVDTTKNLSFEIILVSTDRNLDEFKLNIRDMPWPAIPYEEKTCQDLYRIFNIKGIPTLIVIGPDGKTVSEDGRSLISMFGAEAFPFTESRIRELEEAVEKEAEELPSSVEDMKHEHVLKLEMAKAYVCDCCKKQGKSWAFSCGVCDYDLHPTCIEQRNESM